MKRRQVRQILISAIACVAMAASSVPVAASSWAVDSAAAVAGETSETFSEAESEEASSDVAEASEENVSAAETFSEESVSDNELNVVGAANFTDVTKDKYYYDAINWASTNGILTGLTSGNKFGVSTTSTRAYVVTTIYRAFGSPKVTGTSKFTDVKEGSYYYDAVIWAVENGITSGTSATKFSPDEACTRAHVVSFLQRAYGATLTHEVSAEYFDDVSDKNYYYHSVLWALSYSITSGTSETKFTPNRKCTQAETVTFLYRSAKADPAKYLTQAEVPKSLQTREAVVARNSSTGSDAALESGIYRFESAKNGKFALAVDGNSLEDRGNIEISATRTNNTAQWFSVENLGGGIYTIVNFASEKRLSVQYASEKDGGNIQQYHETDHDAQKWYIRKLENGNVLLVNKYSGRVIEAAGGNVAEGANADQKDGTGESFEQWKAVRVKDTGNFSGWLIRSSQRYYYVDGKPATGKQKIGDKTYTFSDNGILLYKTYVNGYYYDAYGNKASVPSPYRTTINGKKTLKTLLQNCMVPCGRTLYIWGGGWGGAGVDSQVIGVPSSMWNFFTDNATESYNYKDHRYEYGNGLDCSGFVAWAVYNTLYTRNDQADIVVKSNSVATQYQKKGWVNLDQGALTPGDVVSMSGHVWICLGTYSDGSVLLVHSSPRGCQISGTRGKAAERAAYYMTKYYPEWPYAARTVDDTYLKYIHKGTWITDGTGILTDPEGIQKMSADQVMKELFGE